MNKTLSRKNIQKYNIHSFGHGILVRRGDDDKNIIHHRYLSVRRASIFIRYLCIVVLSSASMSKTIITNKPKYPRRVGPRNVIKHFICRFAPLKCRFREILSWPRLCIATSTFIQRFKRIGTVVFDCTLRSVTRCTFASNRTHVYVWYYSR